MCPVPGPGGVPRYVQAGIVAWGIGCGQDGIPGVYANVPYMSAWIQDKLTGIMNIPEDFIRSQLPKVPKSD